MPVVYLTTNLINNKKYIGVDGKNNPSYLGSGKGIRAAVNKYGVESFKKEILFEFSNETDAYIKEIELISKYNAAESSEYYNIHPGGDGGWGHIKTKGSDNPMYGKSVFSVWLKKYGEEKALNLEKERGKKAGKKISSALKGRKLSEGHRKSLSDSHLNFWKNLSDEHRMKISQIRKDTANPYTRDDAHRLLMSEIIKKSRKEKPLPIAKCKYCGLEATTSNISRWHNDKCKHK
jgi:hypothetical protein